MGLLPLLAMIVDVAHTVIGVGVVGVDFERLFVGGQRLIVVLQGIKDYTFTVVIGCHLAIQLDGTLVGAESLFFMIHIQQSIAFAIIGCGVLRVQL